VERRLIPGETKEDVEKELESLLNSIRDIDPDFKGEYEITFFRGPMEVSEDTEICSVLSKCNKEIRGEKPHFVGGSGWMDTQILSSRGIPAVAFGPIGAGSHSSIEYVELDSVVEASKVLESVILTYCN
jgi:acetylornithine deacetylase